MLKWQGHAPNGFELFREFFCGKREGKLKKWTTTLIDIKIHLFDEFNLLRIVGT